MMKMYVAASALLLTLSACSGSKHEPLEGTTWKLSTMAGIPASAIGAEDDAFVVEFNAADMTVSGRTNCNRFFGHYELKGRELDLENMGMTRMACPDMQYEDMFVKMLDEVDRYRIKDSELTFYDDKRVLAVFRPAAKTGESGRNASGRNVSDDNVSGRTTGDRTAPAAAGTSAMGAAAASTSSTGTAAPAASDAAMTSSPAATSDAARDGMNGTASAAASTDVPAGNSAQAPAAK